MGMGQRGEIDSMKNPLIYKKLILFPLLFVYLECILHIFVGFSVRYLPIYLAFCISYGAIVTAIVGLFGNKLYYTISKIFVGLVTLVYAIEYYAKVILQTFYPFSVVKTAAGNHLEEFVGVIVGTVFRKIYVLLLMCIPFILCMMFMKKKARRTSARSARFNSKKRLKSSAVVIISLLLALVTFLCGMFIILVIPSKEDITPKMLYLSDTSYDEQVEKLGLMTMLRLDIKHMIFPPSGGEFSGPEIADEPEPEAVYNIMDFDFDAMNADANNKNLQWLTQYVSTNSASKQNEYTGMFKGYNVVMICMEGFSGYGISPEYTPTLYKLSHEGFVFNNFYTALHYTSTSNGECQLLLGLYPKGGSPISMQRTGDLGTNCYFSLAQQLGRLGYKNFGFHNNQWNLYGREKSHTNLGYTWYGAHNMNARFIIEKKPNGKESDPYGYYWPQKDSYMIDHSVDVYNTTESAFNVYYMTISGHVPGSSYTWNHANAEYKDLLAESGYTDSTNAYIGTCIEVDKAVEHLINSLEAAGTLDNTIIVCSPDHIPYGCVDALEELAGKEFGTSEALSAINEQAIDFDVYKSSLIIWNSKFAEECEQPVVIDKVCCQVDVLPTLSNLLGLEYDSRMLAGSDILSDSEGLVVFSSRSWKSDKGFYNKFTQIFTLADGVEMSEYELDNYVDTMKAIVANKLDSTSKIIESNFYDFAIKYLKETDE